jgi:hypothetical protein
VALKQTETANRYEFACGVIIWTDHVLKLCRNRKEILFTDGSRCNLDTKEVHWVNGGSIIFEGTYKE